MGYILKKDQQDLVNLAKDFAEKKVAPFVHELDQAKEPGQKLLDIYQEAVDMGFCGLEIPEEYGGLGQDYYTVAAVECSVEWVFKGVKLDCRDGVAFAAVDGPFYCVLEFAHVAGPGI